MTPLHVNTSDNKTNKIEKKLIETFFFNQSKGMIFFIFWTGTAESFVWNWKAVEKDQFFKIQNISEKKNSDIFEESAYFCTHIFEQVYDAES